LKTSFRMRFRYWHLFAFVVLSSSGIALTYIWSQGYVRQRQGYVRQVIDAPGSYRLNGVSVRSIRVAPNENGNLRLTVVTNSGSVSAAVDLKPGWFFYAEGHDRIWAYYGSDDLELLESSEMKYDSRSVLVDRKLATEIPQVVLARLPKPFRIQVLFQED
jgi:hypothetical protein